MKECKAHQIDVEAQLQHTIDVRQVVEHNLGVDSWEEAAQHARREENECRVQTYDSVEQNKDENSRRQINIYILD